MQVSLGDLKHQFCQVLLPVTGIHLPVGFVVRALCLLPDLVGSVFQLRLLSGLPLLMHGLQAVCMPVAAVQDLRVESGCRVGLASIVPSIVQKQA